MTKTVPLQNFYEETIIPLRLSCQTPSGWPVVLSLWYLFEAGALYCATPRSARVVEYLRAEPRCAFEVAADHPPYCGVRGQALASIDEQRGLEILERLLLRYTGSVDTPFARNLLNRTVAEVAIRLEPQRVYTWDFSARMAGSAREREQKVCPDS